MEAPVTAPLPRAGWRERLRTLFARKFMRDTLTLQASSLLNSVGNIASTVLLANLLGAREQGEFYVAISLYSLLFFLMNQGVQGATVTQVAAASARGLSDKVAAWLGFLAKAYLLLGLLLAGLGFFVLPWASVHLLKASSTIGWLAAWLCLTPLLELPRVVTSAALQGTRRMSFLARIENGQESLRLFFVVLGGLLSATAVGPVLGMLVASLLGSVIALERYAAARASRGGLLPSVREIARHARDVSLRAGLPLGFKLGAVRSIDALGTQTLPTLILQRVCGPNEVAYLRIAQRILSVPLLMMQGISRNTLPMLSELAGLRDMTRFRRNFIVASLLTGSLISVALLCGLPLIPWGLATFFPVLYREPVWHMAKILVPGFVVMSFSIANDTFYLVTNTLRVGVILCVAMLIVNCLVVWYLAWLDPRYGVAWGLSFTMATASLHYLYAAYWFRRHRREQALPAPAS